MAFHELAHALHLAPTPSGRRIEGAAAGAAAPYWLLVVLTAIGPASFQIFLPSLPAIRDGFGVSEATAQLALSLSMGGIALATLAYGRLADLWGRRPVLLGGMALLLAGSLLCAAAPSIWWLIAGRIVQAAGGASGMVVTRAIVLDMYGRERAGQVMAGLLAAMMIAPMLATPVGGVLNDWVGWRANFLTIGAGAAGTLALVAWLLPETRAVECAPARAGLLADYRRLLASRPFLGFAGQGAFAMGAFVAFSTAAPYALGGELGLSATAVGLSFVVVSLGFGAGSLLATRLPGSLGGGRRVLWGSAAGLAAVAVGLGLALGGVWTVAALIGPAAAFGLVTGVTMPASQAGAIAAVPELSGTASGLAGFLGTLVAAVATQGVGALSDGTPVPVMAGMAALAGAAFGAALLAFRHAPDDAAATASRR